MSLLSNLAEIHRNLFFIIRIILIIKNLTVLGEKAQKMKILKGKLQDPIDKDRRACYNIRVSILYYPLKTVRRVTETNPSVEGVNLSEATVAGLTEQGNSGEAHVGAEGARRSFAESLRQKDGDCFRSPLSLGVLCEFVVRSGACRSFFLFPFAR